MTNLSYIESQFVFAIAETYPFSFQEVKRVYLRTRSFDKTLFVVKQANISGSGLVDIINELDRCAI